MKRTFAVLSMAVVLAITAFAQTSQFSAKKGNCTTCCPDKCGDCCKEGCASDCCQGK